MGVAQWAPVSVFAKQDRMHLNTQITFPSNQVTLRPLQTCNRVAFENAMLWRRKMIWFNVDI